MPKIYLYTLLLLLFSPLLVAQPTGRIIQPISLPEKAIQGTINNEFPYVIMPNDQPKGRVEIRLCLKVGSFQEQKGEEGIAHFLEHLAFSGSKHYPKDSALKFWESLGAKYGENINAYTTDDRTVYSISLSNVNAEQVAKTIHILSDWLFNMDITPADVEKERKIITQEIASYKPYKDLNPIMVGYDEQLMRLPIGTKAQIAKVTPEKLRSFYEKWYNLQNASLIVVGDIDPQATQKAIKEYFGTLEQRGEEVEWLKPISFPNEKKLSIEKEKGKKAKLSLLYPIEYIDAIFIDGYTERIEVPKVVLEILNNRFKASKEDIHTSEYWYLRKTSFLEIEMTSDDIAQTLENTFAIIEGLKSTLTQAEVDKALEKVTTAIEKIPTERTSEDWALSFIDNFIFGERFISQPKDKERIIKELREDYQLHHWQRYCESILNLKDPIIIYTPTTNKKYTYEQFEHIIKEGIAHPNTTVPTFKEEGKVTSATLPEIFTKEITYNPNDIKSETYFKEIGVHRIELTNGATIYLKPTENDEKLNVSLLFKGGYSLLPTNEFKQYEDILQYVHLGGIESLKGEAYEELLYQNNLTFIIGTEGYHHLAMATAPVNKSKELCNLLYQKLRYPERAYEAFEEVKNDEIQSLNSKKNNKKIDPLKEMAFKLEAVKGATYPLTQLNKTSDDVQKMNLDTLYNYYQKNFLSSDGLLCVVTGSFKIEDVKRNLVGTLSHLTKQNGFSVEERVQNPSFQTLKVTQNKRTNFNIVYKDSYQKSLKGVLSIKLLRELLRKEVIAEIREKKGWVYTPYVELEYYSTPSPTFALIVSGETDEKNFTEVEKSVIRIVNHLVKDKKINQKALSDLKHSFIVSKKEYLSDENAYYWRNYLIDCFKNNTSLEELSSYEKILESINLLNQ
ncbi:hypothetical protein RCZ04_12630 [Capnocytophaga sp. HP1101]